MSHQHAITQPDRSDGGKQDQRDHRILGPENAESNKAGCGKKATPERGQARTFQQTFQRAIGQSAYDHESTHHKGDMSERSQFVMEEIAEKRCDPQATGGDHKGIAQKSNRHQRP